MDKEKIINKSWVYWGKIWSRRLIVISAISFIIPIMLMLGGNLVTEFVQYVRPKTDVFIRPIPCVEMLETGGLNANEQKKCAAEILSSSCVFRDRYGISIY